MSFINESGSAGSVGCLFTAFSTGFLLVFLAAFLVASFATFFAIALASLVRGQVRTGRAKPLYQPLRGSGSGRGGGRTLGLPWGRGDGDRYGEDEPGRLALIVFRLARGLPAWLGGGVIGIAWKANGERRWS
jgi:hypothetical protein